MSAVTETEAISQVEEAAEKLEGLNSESFFTLENHLI